MRQKIFCLILFFCVKFSFSQNYQWESHWWRPSGDVNAVLCDSINQTIYLGGQFDYVGPNNPYGTSIDYVTGNPNLQFQVPNAPVKTAVSDGTGGWYIGGDFTKIGNAPRNFIAHINSSGQLFNDFNNKGFNGPVEKIIRDTINNHLYVGGNFSSFDSLTKLKSYLIIVDSTNDKPRLTSDMPNNPVTMSLSDGRGGFFIAGYFSKIGDSSRMRLAHINSLGKVTAWNPKMDNFVTDMKLIGSRLFVSGRFNHVNGVPFRSLMELDTVIGNPTSWYPVVSNWVQSMHIYGQTMFITGDNLSVNNQYRGSLAAIDIVTGTTLPWNPSPNGRVRTIKIFNNKMYLGGEFTFVGGQSRKYCAAIDILSGNATSWSPVPDQYASIYGIEVFKNSAYIVGDFLSINGQSRINVAIVDTILGMLKPLYPIVNGRLGKVQAFGNSIYFLGNFDSINGLRRNGIAAIDAITGQVKPWDLNLTNTMFEVLNEKAAVSTFSTFNSNMLIGGNFVASAGNIVRNIVEIDLNNLSPTNWRPYINRRVKNILLLGNKVYVTGKFSIINGQSRNYIAAIDKTSGVLSTWNPNPNDEVIALATDGKLIYAGGDFYSNNGQFNSIGGQPRDMLAALDTISGNANTWNPSLNGYVTCIEVKSNRIFIGGSFTTVNNLPRKSLASFSLNSGQLDSWSPSISHSSLYYDIVSGISIAANNLFVVGNFDKVGNTKRKYLASIDINSGQLSSWYPKADYYPAFINVTNNKIYLGGHFTSIGGEQRSSLAALDASTGLLKTWNPILSINNTNIIKTMKFLDSAIYIGGKFRILGSQNRNNAASFNRFNGQLNVWNPNLSILDTVYSIEVSNNLIYVGGSFLNIGGQSRHNIGALDKTIGLANNWNPNANNTVNSIAFSNDTVYLGGSFSLLNGQSRNFLGAVNKTTSLTTNWAPSINNVVKSIVPYGNSIFVCGNFTVVGNQNRNYFAELNKSNGLPSSLDFDLEDYYPINRIVRDYQKLSLIAYSSKYYLPFSTTLYETDLISKTVNKIRMNSSFSNPNDFLFYKNKLIIGGDIAPPSDYIYFRVDFGVFSICNIGQPSFSNFTVNSCTPYFWNGSLYNSSGTYVKNLLNSYGCDSVVTMHLVINNINASIISNSNGSISASGGNNFQWVNCTTNQIVIGANSSTFSPSQNGNYAAIVSNNSGCSDTTSCVSFSTSGLKQTNILSTSIYPNPSKDIVSITFSESTGQLEVTDVLGKNKLSQKIQSGESISMKDWPTGIYFFKLRTDKGISNLKVQKR